jgi:two-component system, OmpR family, response regulator
MSAKQTVLVIEDEAHIATMLRYNLEKAGFAVFEVVSGDEALHQIAEHKPDAILLDWGLPGVSGYEVCRQIRSSSEFRTLPVIMLTARGDEVDKVRALDNGADDYVTKPFNPRELLARIRAVLRRTGDSEERQAENAAKTYSFSGWVLETARRRLLDPNGVEVAITGGEYDLLVALLDRPNRVLTRDMLLDLLRGRQAGPFDRAIDVAVSRLRRKLEDDGRNAQLIKTVRGGGYVLSTPVERH